MKLMRLILGIASLAMISFSVVAQTSDRKKAADQILRWTVQTIETELPKDLGETVLEECTMEYSSIHYHFTVKNPDTFAKCLEDNNLFSELIIIDDYVPLLCLDAEYNVVFHFKCGSEPPKELMLPTANAKMRVSNKERQDVMKELITEALAKCGDSAFQYQNMNNSVVTLSIPLEDELWNAINPDVDFLSGMIQGYFADNAPERIIPLVCLYLAKGEAVSFINESTGKKKNASVPFSRLRVITSNAINDITSVDVMPLFQGRDRVYFTRWVDDNIVYPEQAKRDGITGTVTISLTIDESGDVVNAQVVKGAYPLLDAEALRVVNKSPKWTPGYHDGKPVRVTFTFPIHFQLK